MDRVDVRLSSSPDDIRTKFSALRTPQDIADLLEINLKRLYYHIYIVPESARYNRFDIPKRRGGVRTISAPVTALKIIQRKLNMVLLEVHSPKPCVHSFLIGRSVLSNAQVHVGRRNVLSIDLKDFFPSINFGRVRGLFMGIPYRLDSSVATVLAQICCCDNQLPQGAPSSPIVTNMICAKMDSELMKLAKANRSDYTRYSDDITFSTNLREFPSVMAFLDELGQVQIGAELERIVAENGFTINSDKTRLRRKVFHQEVTGITVNRFPNVRRKYIRQIRAMLHAWSKFGLEAAQKEFLSQYDKKHRNPNKEVTSFKKVVKGKIGFLGMIRGRNDDLYIGLCERLRELAPELVPKTILMPPVTKHMRTIPLIMTEGKTDCMHLRAALQDLRAHGLYEDLNIEFDDRDIGGNVNLMSICAGLSMTRQSRPIVCVFDRDNLEIVKKACPEGVSYKAWGNNVFSCVIPIPEHRTATPNISIEFYYQDCEIMQEDESGRRMFLSNEFDADSGRHNTLNLNCIMISKIRDHVSVIDHHVYDAKKRNIALPKADFANYVLNKKSGYDKFDFSEFGKIFDMISTILESNQ
jgi:RNA-directed DNA polymerase